MGRLFFVQSNRMSRLAELFSEAVRAERAARAPLDAAFASVHVVTCGRLVDELLRRTCASRLGIAANFVAEPLPALLARGARTLDSEARVIDRDALTGWILTQLHDDALLAEGALEPLRRYLDAAGADPLAVARRRLEICARLVPLFEGCAMPARGDEPGPPAGTWQRRLWDGLFGETGLVTETWRKTGVRWTWLAEAFRGVDPAALGLPPALHLFALPPWTPLLPRVLPALVGGCDVHLYYLQPCREHAEDFDEAERRGLSSVRFPPRAAQLSLGAALEAPGADEDAGAPAAVTSWARPAREGRRRLLGLVAPARVHVTSAFETPRSKGLLAAVQRRILDRGARAEKPPVTDDVAFFACPGLRREVETIAAEIWRLCESSADGPAPLRFDEIGVYVPAGSVASYATHVAAVFREAADLPHRLVDVAAARGSRVFEAADLAIALPLGAFTRKEVMRLLLHPSVLARFPDVTAEDWLGLPERLGVAHGADRTDHAGTYIDADLFNWDQGLRRLGAAAFLTTTGDDEAVSAGPQPLMPAHVSAAELPAALSFGLCVRSLVSDAAFARQARLPLPTWATFLRALVGGLVAADGAEDERALAACADALGGLCEIPIAGPVSYALAAGLARDALAALTATRAAQPAQGITIAPLSAGRVVPFRVVFVAGLGAGLFPATDEDDELDPRAPGARAVDATKAEQERALFLEALLGAGERFVVSHVARNVLTGDPLEPSPVVRDLRAMVDDVREGAAAACTRTPPLHRHEDAHVRAVFAAPGREERARLLGLALAPDEATAPPAFAALARVLPPATAARVADVLGLSLPAAGGAADARPRAARVSLTALRKFLECPLQTSAARVLGLREGDDEGELVQAEDEPFETSRLDRARLLRDSALAAMQHAASRGRLLEATDVEAAYAARAEKDRLRGQRPLGPFGEADGDEQREVLRGWADELRALAPVGVAPLPWLLGGGEEHDLLGLSVPALRLYLSQPLPGYEGAEIEVVGRTSALLTSPAGDTASIVLPTAERKQAAAHDEKEALKGYLDALVIAARRPAGVPARPHTVHVLRPGAKEPFVRRWAPMDTDEACAALVALARELHAGVHAYLLPCEAVFAMQRTPEKSLRALVDDAFEKGPCSSAFGPVPFPERYRVPSEHEAAAMIARRFGRFFAGAS